MRILWEPATLADGAGHLDTAGAILRSLPSVPTVGLPSGLDRQVRFTIQETDQVGRGSGALAALERDHLRRTVRLGDGFSTGLSTGWSVHGIWDTGRKWLAIGLGHPSRAGWRHFAQRGSRILAGTRWDSKKKTWVVDRSVRGGTYRRNAVDRFLAREAQSLRRVSSAATTARCR